MSVLVFPLDEATKQQLVFSWEVSSSTVAHIWMTLQSSAHTHTHTHNREMELCSSSPITTLHCQPGCLPVCLSFCSWWIYVESKQSNETSPLLSSRCFISYKRTRVLNTKRHNIKGPYGSFQHSTAKIGIQMGNFATFLLTKCCN